ncbi:MAG: PaREP1 family protein [Dehalococcoidia bacterium]|nr:PaREP1 family protein [Dehalococcoidia bacterium]
MQSSEAYLGRAQEYWKQANEFLEQQHFLKVSELAWGSVVQMVHALAVKQGIKLTTHKELINYVRKIASMLGDREMQDLLKQAEKLHANFYHQFLDEADIRETFGAIERLLEKIGELLVKEGK